MATNIGDASSIQLPEVLILADNVTKREDTAISLKQLAIIASVLAIICVTGFVLASCGKNFDFTWAQRTKLFIFSGIFGAIFLATAFGCVRLYCIKRSVEENLNKDAYVKALTDAAGQTNYANFYNLIVVLNEHELQEVFEHFSELSKHIPEKDLENSSVVAAFAFCLTWKKGVDRFVSHLMFINSCLLNAIAKKAKDRHLIEFEKAIIENLNEIANSKQLLFSEFYIKVHSHFAKGYEVPNEREAQMKNIEKLLRHFNKITGFENDKDFEQKFKLSFAELRTRTGLYRATNLRI